MFDEYVREEVVPFVWANCQSHGHRHRRRPACRSARSTPPTRCSSTRTSSSAATRCPGVYDMKRFMDGMYDENFYFNNPVDYVPNLSRRMVLGPVPDLRHPHRDRARARSRTRGRRCTWRTCSARSTFPHCARRLGAARRPRLAVLEAPAARVPGPLVGREADADVLGCGWGTWKLRPPVVSARASACAGGRIAGSGSGLARTGRGGRRVDSSPGEVRHEQDDVARGGARPRRRNRDDRPGGLAAGAAVRVGNTRRPRRR